MEKMIILEYFQYHKRDSLYLVWKHKKIEKKTEVAILIFARAAMKRDIVLPEELITQ